MKAIEVSGFLDEKGQLNLDTPIKIVNQRVKVILLIPEEEEISDAAWLNGMASNSAFKFLEDEAEDIYTINDGQPMQNEV